MPVLESLLAAFPGVRCFAVGRIAAQSLAQFGVAATPLRHPSMGGATAFRAGLHRALAEEDSTGIQLTSRIPGALP